MVLITHGSRLVGLNSRHHPRVTKPQVVPVACAMRWGGKWCSLRMSLRCLHWRDGTGKLINEVSNNLRE